MIRPSILKHGRQRLAAIDLAGTGLALLWWVASGGQAGFWPLTLALAPALARRRLGRPLWRSTSLDVFLFLFLATALVGIWTTYDGQAAWGKLWLIVGALLLFYALARQPRSNLWLAAGGFAAMGVLTAAYFLLTHDWRAFPAKFAAVNRIGNGWMAIRPAIGGPPFHPNVMGGVMALLLPYILAFGLMARSRRWLRGMALAAAAAGFAVVALVFTSSRGAMLALSVALALWILWKLSQRLGPVIKLSPFHVFSLFLISAPLLFVLASLPAGGPAALLGRLPGADSGIGRLELARQTMDLIGDFPFTGGGLKSFPGLYSQYILVIPFYFLPNGHNIFLDVALEQGILGMLAFLGIILGTVWLLVRSASPAVEEPASYPLSHLRWAAASSLVVMLLHGLVEDTVYGSSALPLLFAAPGLAVSMNRPPQLSDGEWEQRWRRWSAVVVATGVAIVALLLFLSPSWRANWYANLGAVRMAHVELAQWPTGKWADGSQAVALKPAKTLFRQSVASDSTNRTARYRLGLLAMMRRDYEEAVAQLSIARAMDADHQGIRKTLGYSYLWAGQLAESLPLLRGLRQIEREMEVYIGWWGRRDREDLAAMAADMLARLHQSSNAN